MSFPISQRCQSVCFLSFKLLIRAPPQNSDSASLTTITKRSASSVAAKEGGLERRSTPCWTPAVTPTGASQPYRMAVLQTGGVGRFKGGRESTSSITGDQQREQTDSETDIETDRQRVTVCRGDAVTRTKGRQSPSDPQQSALPACTFYVLKTLSLL